MVDVRLKNMQKWLFPGSCLLCDARVPREIDVCAECERSLPRIPHGCPQCAAPVFDATAGTVPCGQCQSHPPYFTHARAAFAYRAPIDRLIQGLKYHGQLNLSRALGDFLVQHLNAVGEPLPDLIVPVPLHRSRLRERGYNQALEIARTVARQLQVPLGWRGSARIRATSPQTQLPRKLREKNVRGAFRANAALADYRVAIVDDVMTSGHTVNAFAAALRKAGAKDVVVWVVARAG